MGVHVREPEDDDRHLDDPERLPDRVARVRRRDDRRDEDRPVDAAGEVVAPVEEPVAEPHQRLRSALHPAGLDGREQSGVVAVVLLGVRLAERENGPLEDVARAQVAGDRDAVARARVGVGERRRAELPVDAQRPRVHRLDDDRALPVAQLAHVVVARLAEDALGTPSQPRKMSLEACMMRCPATTRSPALPYSLLPTNSSSTEAWPP